MTVKTYSALGGISETEQQDFRSVLHEYGLPADEFIAEAEISFLDVDRRNIARTVTVTRNTNGVQRTYRRRRALAWVTWFQANFEAGLYERWRPARKKNN